MKNKRRYLRLNPGQKFLLESLRSGCAQDVAIDDNLPRYWQPYLYTRLSQLPAGAPPCFRDLLSRFRETYLQNLAKNDYFLREAAAISKALKKIGIAPVFFKGISLLNTAYKNEGTRVMSDIDFLVKKNEIPRLGPVLSGLGYRFEKDVPRMHSIYSKGLLCVEPHWRIGLDSREKTHNRLFRERSPLDLCAGQIDILSPGGNIFAVCLNFCRTHISFPCASLAARRRYAYLFLYSLYDIKRITEFYADRMDWQGLLRLAKTDRKEFEVFTLLLLAQGILGVGIPDEIANKMKSNAAVRVYLRLTKGLEREDCLQLCAVRSVVLKILLLAPLISRPKAFLENIRSFILVYLYLYRPKLFWAWKKFKRKYLNRNDNRQTVTLECGKA